MNNGSPQELTRERGDGRQMDFLLNPVLRLDYRDVAEMFEVSTARVVCVRPQNLEDFPDLPVRLRGALGRALHESGPAVQGRADPLRRLPPFEFLFGSHGYYKPSAEVPKPLVVRACVEAETLVVDVKLLGHAQYYVTHVIEALVVALEAGVSLSQHGRVRTPLEVVDAGIAVENGIAKAGHGGEVVLNFRTPLCIRSGQSLTAATDALIASAITRFDGLCRWLDIEPQAEWKELRNCGRQIEADYSETTLVNWIRHSIRQRDRDIPMSGHVGKLRLRGALEPLLPLFLCCEQFGIGSHAALGLGWFEMAIYP